MHLKLNQKRRFKKKAEATGDFFGNKIADKITRASETSHKNNSETNEKEIHKERYKSPNLTEKIIDDLRLKKEND